MSEMLSEDNSVKMIHSKHQQSVHQQHQQQNMRKSVGVMGTRRIFTTIFKIKVLDSYRHDKDCRQNQRATARKYGIHRRQIQKWLQCETQLRNSVENGNTGTVSSTTASPTSVSKSESTVAEAAGSTVTPATPALNLNLARQHGDELTTQQGPPPSHPPHDSAPSSPQYNLQTTTTSTVLPLCVGPVDYQDYPSEQHLRSFYEEDRIHRGSSEVHGFRSYSDIKPFDRIPNYYTVVNGDKRDAEVASAFSGRNEMKVYQALTSYHSPRQEHRYNVNDISNSAHNHSPNHPPQQREQSYGNVDSFDVRSYSMLPAPSMIKTEPASPDIAATPGLYEPTLPVGSPSGPRAPLSPESHRDADSGGSSSSVHFVDSSRAPASPYLHVHAHEHAHTCLPLDSEKPIPSLRHEQERESEETTQHTEEKREEEIQEKTEYRTWIKEEVDLDKEEPYDEGEEVTAASCVDYQRPSVGGSSPDSSGPVSPIYDRIGYSLPSSPRNSASTGKATRNSWSDSEMEPLVSSTSLNSSGNFTRRRSFPLRFKLEVLDAFHQDKEVKENQRATARKFGINRRQVQKWLEQEPELRDESALRGDSRQRLGPIQDVASSNDLCDSPLDLTTTSYASLQVTNCISLLRDRLEMEDERLPAHNLGRDVDSSSSLHPSNYQYCSRPSSEIESVAACSNLSCSVDSHTTTSTTSSYQELSLREPWLLHRELPCNYSSNSVVSNFSEGFEIRVLPPKRHHCTTSCYDTTPKRFCDRPSDVDDSYDVPQDMPLCLVKPKLAQELSRTEMITKTINQSIGTVSTSNNPDAITFKPYLDNPVSKPMKKYAVQRDLSPTSNHNINNNNNNYQLICNFNENQNRNYDVEVNLQVPVSWRPDLNLYTGFPQPTFVSVSSLHM